jgi:hyperosmotically inducible periplasmic protein
MRERGRRWTSGAALLAVLLVGTYASPVSASTSGDAWITTKVKLALLTKEGVGFSRVNVDTVDAAVTLHGNVATRLEKESAERDARAVAGVASVRNLLQVVPDVREATVAATDDRIAADVGLALQQEQSLRDSNVSVASVHKGVVLLRGSAADLTDQLTAVQVAARSPGVRRVASEVRGPGSLVDDEIWRETACETHTNERRAQEHASRQTAQASDSTQPLRAHGPPPAAGTQEQPIREDAVPSQTGIVPTTTARTAGGAASDLYITSKVKMQLLADSRTPGLDINVDTYDGNVTLFGIVPDEDAKVAAGADARDVAGVQSVRNDLQVVASFAKPAVVAKDEELRTDLARHLEMHEDLGNVDIDVKNCVARLTGTVTSGLERLEAMQVARRTSGICSVQDDLRVND